MREVPCAAPLWQNFVTVLTYKTRLVLDFLVSILYNLSDSIVYNNKQILDVFLLSEKSKQLNVRTGQSGRWETMYPTASSTLSLASRASLHCHG